MIYDPLIPYPWFTYDIADDNGTDYPIYRVYNDCQEPQAAFIQFDLEEEHYFFLADYCTDYHHLSKPMWNSNLIRVPISPLVSHADIDNLSTDLNFYNLARGIYQGFTEETGKRPCEFTEDAKNSFIELESYLKHIKVTHVEENLLFYKQMKSKSLPPMMPGLSTYPPWVSDEGFFMVNETWGI